MNKKKYIMIVMIIAMLVLSFTACAKRENPADLVLDSESKEKLTEASGEEAVVVNTGAAVIKVTEANFEEKILNSSGVILVDFWAEWCGPCVSLAPILEEVSTESGIVLAKLNVDENPSLANEYKINAIPAVYVFVDGVAVETIIGLNSKEVYIKVINEYK